MITLTYAPGNDWKPNHIRDFMLKLRKVMKDGLLAYAWVAELQKRGAIHYHILLYCRGRVPRPDEMGLWLHGMSRVDIAKTPFYILKYTGKEYQKEFAKFPKGIRVFSVWVSDKAAKEILKYSTLPVWCEAVARVDGLAVALMVREARRIASGWRYDGVLQVSFGAGGQVDNQVVSVV
ncbi:MAG: hypothetical protein H7835_19045 [Magnetococcus sp. XQGC-1]